MEVFPLRSDAVSLAVTATGGHLGDVVFRMSDGRRVAPMHTAPWIDEPLPEDLPPMQRILRGDFFCAPFGASNIIPTERRGHGTPANGEWRVQASGEGWLDALLTGEVMGATLTKHIELRPGEAMVYERHTFSGGEGRLPIAHHAMLKAETELRLGFSPWVWAATPPKPHEEPPTGTSMLAYPQRLFSLRTAVRPDGRPVDLTVYPSVDGHEDLWMLASDASRPFSWTAATCPAGGWVWFSLKNPRVLPGTVNWLSNGGRTFPPFSGRHRGVIGLEEVCAYFAYGHAASTSANPLAAMGIPTSVELRRDASLSISYAFGVAPVPAGFGAVADILPEDGGVVLVDDDGLETFAACDLSFVADSEPRLPAGNA